MVPYILFTKMHCKIIKVCDIQQMVCCLLLQKYYYQAFAVPPSCPAQGCEALIPPSTHVHYRDAPSFMHLGNTDS